MNVRKDLVVDPPEFKVVSEIRIKEEDLNELNKIYRENRNQE